MSCERPLPGTRTWGWMARVTAAFACTVPCVAFLGLPANVAAGELEADFISVGQADAILVRCPDRNNFLLIDAGDTRYPGSADHFKDYLGKALGTGGRLSVVVATHVHADHVGSMKWVLDTYPVGTYIDSGDKSETAMWARLERTKNRLVKQGKTKYVNAKKAAHVEIRFCPGEDVTMEIVEPWAYGKKLADPNDRSVVVRLQYKQTSFLFVGDVEHSAEDLLLTGTDESLRKKLHADVLKVGHHGADTSSSMKFVMAVQPKIAIISSGEREVGTNVRYKHPRYSTIDTYSSWFANAGNGSASPDGQGNGTVWAYDKEKSTWRQHARPGGLWLTNTDGTVMVRSDGARVEAQPGG